MSRKLPHGRISFVHFLWTQYTLKSDRFVWLKGQRDFEEGTVY